MVKISISSYSKLLLEMLLNIVNIHGIEINEIWFVIVQVTFLLDNNFKYKKKTVNKIIDMLKTLLWKIDSRGQNTKVGRLRLILLNYKLFKFTLDKMREKWGKVKTRNRVIL